MSAATRTSAGEPYDGSKLALAEPPALRRLEILTGTATVALLVIQALRGWQGDTDLLKAAIPWLLVVAIADLLPVRLWRSVELMMSFPVLLAAAFVFPPYLAAAISFVATIDVREVKHEITALRGLLNRSNIALSVFAGSSVFHALGGDVDIWPNLLVAAIPAVVVDVGVNASLLILGTHFLTGQSPSALLRNIYGGAQSTAFLAGYAAFGLLAIVLATVVSSAGAWGLVVFAAPLLLSRQMFIFWKDMSAATQVIDEKRRVLSEVTSRIADERRDERRALAAGIHDEVLPPLYKAHLMGEVLRRDMAGGRLLDLEADIPDLVLATEAANAALRHLVSGLRESQLGVRGLAETLRLLIRHLESETDSRFQVDLTDIGGSPLVQLLLYQIAREALSNAAIHSRARVIRISLRVENDHARLQVLDDGRGFDPSVVDRSKHFGIQLMRERAELAGGELAIASTRGEGTLVVLRVPLTDQAF